MIYMFLFQLYFFIFVFYLFFRIHDHVPLHLAHPTYPTHGSPHTGRLKEVLLYRPFGLHENEDYVNSGEASNRNCRIERPYIRDRFKEMVVPGQNMILVPPSLYFFKKGNTVKCDTTKNLCRPTLTTAKRRGKH
jgi:hypothetical protein